jgi:phage protein D
MAASWQLLLGGQPADPDLTTLIAAVEVEESMDLPGAVQIVVPVSRSSTGDFTYVSDARFAPLASVAVVATAGGSGASGVVRGAVGAVAAALGGGAAPSATQCIFDGYVLSQKLHLETGTTNARLTVWGQDASWLMNLTEKVKEWVDVSDADVAAAIFSDYGITSSEENAADDAPAHTENGHSLMQRASDIQFLRMLARRNGKVCRVACADQPGVRTGYFAKPKLDGEPAATIVLNDPTNRTIGALDLDWDATRPSSVVARQALFSDPDAGGVSADTSDSGLALLGDRGLAAFAGKPMTVLLAAPVDSAGELTLRAQAVLRDADWFVRCEADADVDRLGVVLRAGMIVSLVGIGALHSGSYLVWRVRHRITQEAHTMKFVLLRNAVGNPPAGGAGGLSGVAGTA